MKNQSVAKRARECIGCCRMRLHPGEGRYYAEAQMTVAGETKKKTRALGSDKAWAIHEWQKIAMGLSREVGWTGTETQRRCECGDLITAYETAQQRTQCNRCRQTGNLDAMRAARDGMLALRALTPQVAGPARLWR